MDWRIINDLDYNHYMQEYKINALLAKVFAYKQYSSQEIETMLSSRLVYHDFSLFSEAEMTLERIHEAIGNKEKHCWTGRIADTEILFSIILNTSELRSANLDFIRSVLQNWREYLSKAEHEIQAQIGKSPEKFGLQRAPFPETEIPAEQPQFLFYDETEWGLHFEICTLPVGEPFGLMVEFSGDTPTDVYGLSEAEEIEADME